MRRNATLVATVIAAQTIFAAGWQMKQAPLMTQWASQVDTNNPLPEYPRPQMVRSNWLSLNGIWQFESGVTNTDPVPTNQTLSSLILVPYPMESAISGMMQYNAWSWYRRTFTVPTNWAGHHIILHFDAVDWQSQVYINGQSVGTHKGGYDQFSYDITAYLTNGGTQELIVQVFNPVDNGSQPRGKQTLYPGGIMYTSASGIWQTVWLEPVDAAGAQNIVLIPDVDNSRLKLTVNTYSNASVTVFAQALNGTNVVSSASGLSGSEIDLSIANPNLWSPNNPFLYGMQIALVNAGVTNDFITSYFGMRKISTNIVGGVPWIYLNNQPIFGMGPLDQGYWPDGIYTAPTDEALKFDLQQIKALGYNTIRKHEKVERPRWYYWADALGLMVWQDMPTCNSYTGNPDPPVINPLEFIAELSALVTNHWNSPSIIMWDIFNEDQGEAGSSDGVGQTNTAYLVGLVEGLDPSRLVNQASGGAYFGIGNVLDNHNYPPPGNPTSTTQAAVDGEFGGIGLLVTGHMWNPAEAFYGDVAESSGSAIAPLYDQYIDEILGYKPGGLNAAIYTQITDVENECDGLLTYDRVVVKPDPTRIMESNEKAISGQMNATAIVPTSQAVPQTWQYTTNTNTASTNWYATDFNDASWSTGLAGFGTDDPNVTPNTTWNTLGYIWLRRTFNPGNLISDQISNLVFYVYHDEDVVIYVNGVQAAQQSGYTTTYVTLPMNAQAQAAIIPNGTNVMAVSCYQTTGGQFIDVGINSDHIVANTLTTPTDFAGYWSLNETNGTVAADFSGNGDNGTVFGATWNPQGKINGCLAFNGTNSYVQINRDVTNDFSIAFWGQTIAIGGTGNWRQGEGLVDGSIGPGNTDFGTSLVGNQLAFGVGNPDVTLLSTNPVNDGNWHLCVATRTQSTGAMNLYLDGNLQATATGSTNTLSGPPPIIFGRIQSGGGFFAGNLDEIKIYDRALGNLEIAALYADGTTPPSTPTNVTAVGGNGSVTLGWWESPVASSYNVSRSLTSGGPYSLVANVDGAGFTDSNVVNGTTYYYVVSAEDSDGVSTNSSEVSATPANVVAWFKADAITGLSGGASISNWPDVSGVGNNAKQTNAIRQPTYVTNSMNGLPVVRFNTANSNYLSFNRPVQDDFTIACVFRSTQGLNSGTYYYQGAGLVNGEVAGVVNDFGTCLFSNGQISAGTGNPDVSVNSSAGFNDGKPHLFVFERVESAGLVSLYADGNLAGTTNGGTQSLTSPSVLVLGAQQTLLYFLSGDIAEVKIYNSALSNPDRIALQNSLASKWGLSGPAAPTQLTASAGNAMVTLSWSSVSDATGYVVQRSTNSGGPYSVIGDVSASPFTDSNLVNGVTYYYVVASTNALLESANSQQVNATPSTNMLLGWFRADAISGVTNGGLLALWPDVSGNNNNATQTNSASQPLYITNGMSGLPVVRFTNSRNTSLSFPRPVQNDFSIICVFQSSQGLNSGTQFYQGAGLVSGFVANGASDFGTSLNASGRILSGTGNPDTSIESAPSFNDGKPHVMTFTRVQSSGLITLYVDGAQAASTTAGTQSLAAPSVLTLGAQQTLANYLSGDIAEVQIYGVALSNSTRQSIETALRIKYLGLARPGIATPTFNTGNLTLSWPTIPGFGLYYATNLAPPVVWSSVTAPIFSENGTDSVTLPPTNAVLFFQLIDP